MVDRLEPFVGTWRIEAAAFGEEPEALTSFEWALDGRFLLQRSEIPVPGAPSALMVIAPDAEGDGFTQHYFDSRGVVRLYAMTLEGREWTLTRDSADFSELPFRQRWTSTFSADGSAIEGRWERTDGPAGEWMLDFELRYVRL